MSHAVLYRWKIRSGREEDFASAWVRMTDVLIQQCGCLGSRLHRADDGAFVAYSYWPSKKAWELAQIHAPKSAARALMAAAIEERFPEMHMAVLGDRFPEDQPEPEDAASRDDASPPDADGGK